MTRQITITPVLNGFICGVGCQQVVFSSKISLINALSDYYENPEKVEKLWVESALNKMPLVGLLREPGESGETLGRERP